MTKQMQHQSIYEKAALPEGARCIRLLTFDRNEKDELFGSLHVRSLDDEDIEWVALSYTWSSAEPTNDTSNLATIDIDGQSLDIQHNLFRALHSLLDRKREARLTFEAGSIQRTPQWGSLPEYDCSFRISQWHHFWIDSICIDQENLLERNHQITLMSDIFSGAKLVIGWLTPTPSRFCAPMLNSVELRDLAHLKSTDPIGSIRHARIVDKSVKSDREDLRAAIILNEYWRRMWIVQEVIVCPRIIFLYENLWLPIRFLLDVGGMASKLRTLLNDRADYHWNSSETCEWRRSVRVETGQRLHLLPLMIKYQSQSCTDARDRIYALLGLLPNQNQIRPDYSKSSYELLVDVIYAGKRDGFAVRNCIRVVSDALQLHKDDLVVWALERFFAVLDAKGDISDLHYVRYPRNLTDVAIWLLYTRKGRRAMAEYIALFLFNGTEEQAVRTLQRDATMKDMKTNRIKRLVAKLSPHFQHAGSSQNHGLINTPGPTFDDAVGFIDRLKLSQPEIYDTFLKILREVQQDGLSTDEYIAKISSLFGGNHELISAICGFLPNGHTLNADDLPSELLVSPVSAQESDKRNFDLPATGDTLNEKGEYDREVITFDDEDNEGILYDLDLEQLFFDDSLDRSSDLDKCGSLKSTELTIGS